jgi:hypothetical protein
VYRVRYELGFSVRILTHTHAREKVAHPAHTRQSPRRLWPELATLFRALRACETTGKAGLLVYTGGGELRLGEPLGRLEVSAVQMAIDRYKKSAILSF